MFQRTIVLECTGNSVIRGRIGRHLRDIEELLVAKEEARFPGRVCLATCSKTLELLKSIPVLE